MFYRSYVGFRVWSFGLKPKTLNPKTLNPKLAVGVGESRFQVPSGTSK